MTLAAILLAFLLIVILLVQLPPIVAFVRTLKRGAERSLAQGRTVSATEALHVGRPHLIKARQRSGGSAAQSGSTTTAVLDWPGNEIPGEGSLPRAICVLCLRGRDPFLKDCLTGLLQQDYPLYDVLIVVDSEIDPALETVHEVLRELPPEHRRAGEVWIEVIEQVYPYCALKGSALIHAARVIRSLPYQVVVLLDADTVPHPTWLQELVEPFQDPKIGVTSGNRWYMPQDAGWGSLIRYIWNVGAVVQMFWNRFTWGGSVALRKELFCDRELSARWRRSLSTDTVIYQVARHHGWETYFVPTILMVNRESCSVRKLFPWVTRQLLVGKLYHPGWPWVLGHGLGTSIFLALGIAFCLGALAWGDWTAFAIVLGVLLAYWAGNVFIVHAVETAVQRIVARQTRETRWLTPWVWTKLIMAMPITQFFNAAAIVATFFVTSVSWRGIRYRLEGSRVRMEQYRPFSACVAPAAHTLHSL